MNRIRRRHDEPTLTQVLAGVLDGRTMGVVEAADAARRAGYRTRSRNFRVPVAMALSEGPFRRVARGRYTAWAGARRAIRVRRSPLIPVLERLLRGRVLSVTEATGAVRRTGYRSNAKSLYSAVGNALAMKPRLFRRVERGLYTSAAEPA